MTRWTASSMGKKGGLSGRGSAKARKTSFTHETAIKMAQIRKEKRTNLIVKLEPKPQCVDIANDTPNKLNKLN